MISRPAGRAPELPPPLPALSGKSSSPVSKPLAGSPNEETSKCSARDLGTMMVGLIKRDAVVIHNFIASHLPVFMDRPVSDVGEKSDADIIAIS